MFMTVRRTYLPNITALACSTADTYSLCLKTFNLSYLPQNHSSMTRLKQVVYRCQMYDTAESWLPNMI